MTFLLTLLLLAVPALAWLLASWTAWPVATAPPWSVATGQESGAPWT